MTVYRIQSNERLDEAATRIFAELSEQAAAELDSKDVEEGIHEARKNFKKARGLARLIRADLDDYHRINRSYRDAGRALAPIRDAHAFFETYTTISETPPANKAIGKLRPHFAKESKRATKRLKRKEKHRLEEASSQMKAAGLDESGWSIEDEADVIRAGLAKTYGRGKEALKVAAETGDPADFHEARKRVKYLWYQVRLLRDSAPSVLRPLASSLHDVSDALGDAHDLALMVGEVADAKAKPDSIQSFQVVAIGYMKELESRAFSLASRLYVEEPDAFASRLAEYWNLWKKGDELETGEIEVVVEADDLSVQFA